MPLVGITGFRARSFWFVPVFAFHAQRSITQMRNAPGCIVLALLSFPEPWTTSDTLFEKFQADNATPRRGTGP